MQSPQPLHKGAQNCKTDGGSLEDLPKGTLPLRLPSKSHPTLILAQLKILTEQNLSKLEPRNSEF